jgi:hypothetical protein
MFARITTVAFEGIEARAVDVQIQIGPGVPAFTIVGLPDKAVAESRERVRGALNAMLATFAALFTLATLRWLEWRVTRQCFA